MTLSLVRWFILFGSPLVCPEHCRLGTSHKTCSLGGTLAHSSSHYSLALVKVTQNLTLFQLSTHPLQGQYVHWLPNIFHSLLIVMREPMFFTLPVHAHTVMGDRCIFPSLFFLVPSDDIFFSIFKLLLLGHLTLRPHSPWSPC